MYTIFNIISFKGQAITVSAKIRDIPRQNFKKNREMCLGKKLQCPFYKILSVLNDQTLTEQM